jgi:NAD(P)-dependent dehydrogenase (short-subunit alcohol dehydrogenase family)
MPETNTLIIGGTRGIGLVIKDALVRRGDNVYTASRSDSINLNHQKINLPNDANLDINFKLNNLIFAHRYRGDIWDHDFEVTLKSVEFIINNLKNKFCGEGSIVILGSNAGNLVYKEQTVSYHATRAALNGLVKYYAVNLGLNKIRCNLVVPSTVIKPENKDFYSVNNNKRKFIEKITPLGRMGSAEDIANLVEFLCSNKSSFITGQTFLVDGGISLLSQESMSD